MAMTQKIFFSRAEEECGVVHENTLIFDLINSRERGCDFLKCLRRFGIRKEPKKALRKSAERSKREAPQLHAPADF